MGSVKVVVKEKVGDITHESEYTFSDSTDFFCWEEQKLQTVTSFDNEMSEALKNLLKSK